MASIEPVTVDVYPVIHWHWQLWCGLVVTFANGFGVGWCLYWWLEH